MRRRTADPVYAPQVSKLGPSPGTIDQKGNIAWPTRLSFSLAGLITRIEDGVYYVSSRLGLIMYAAR